MSYAIEMLNITKEFPGIKANDNVTLQVEQGEIHALLGMNSPLGCILAALFVSYINVGGNYMQACNIPVEIIDVISAVIIYFSSFALMIRLYLQNHEKKKHKKEVAVEGGQE